MQRTPGVKMQRVWVGSVFQRTEKSGSQKKTRSDTNGIHEDDAVSHQQKLEILDGHSRAVGLDAV